MNRLFTLTFVWLAFTAVAFAEEITFTAPGRHFRAVKDSSEFKYSDEQGERSLQIKGCNKTVVDQFWNKMVSKLKSTRVTQTQESKKTADRKAPADGIVTYDGIKYTLVDFEPAYTHFAKIPKQVHFVFAESAMACHKK